MIEVWAQQRPVWCPHALTCQYRVSSQSRLCFGELPAAEMHDGTPNTHRLCIKAAPDDGDWTFTLQINRGDGWAIWRLLGDLFGFRNHPVHTGGE